MPMDLDRVAREIALNAITEALRISGLKATGLARRAKVAPSTVNKFLADPWGYATVPTLVTVAKLTAAAGMAWPYAGSLNREIDPDVLTQAIAAALGARRDIAPEISAEALAGIVSRLYRLIATTAVSEAALAALAKDMLSLIESPGTATRKSKTEIRKASGAA